MHGWSVTKSTHSSASVGVGPLKAAVLRWEFSSLDFVKEVVKLLWRFVFESQHHDQVVAAAFFRFEQIRLLPSSFCIPWRSSEKWSDHHHKKSCPYLDASHSASWCTSCPQDVVLVFVASSPRKRSRFVSLFLKKRGIIYCFPCSEKTDENTWKERFWR